MNCELVKSALRPSASAQRIRVGLTGLAAIFLMVMVAAAGMRPAQSMAPADAHAETLSVLGVAPGAKPEMTARHGSHVPAMPRKPSRI